MTAHSGHLTTRACGRIRGRASTAAAIQVTTIASNPAEWAMDLLDAYVVGGGFVPNSRLAENTNPRAFKHIKQVYSSPIAVRGWGQDY